MTDSDDATFPTLTVTGGPFDGLRLVVPAGEPRTIGSAEDSGLHLDLANLDLAHAQIVWDSRGLLVSDLESSTGTYVNGEKVTTDHPLHDGDRVFLGPPGSKQTAKLAVHIPAGAPIPVEVSEDPRAGSDEEPLVLSQEHGEPQQAPVAPAPPEPSLTDTPPPPPIPRKPEYTSDVPSIEPNRPREPVSLPDRPPAPPSAPLPRGKATPRKSPPIPRAALIGAGAAVLAVAAYLALRMFQTPPPVLTSITPSKAEVGATVSLNGTGFGSSAGGVTVRFGDSATGTVTSASDTQVAVAIPEGLPGGGNVSVLVETRTGRSNALFLKVSATPRITSFKPDVAMSGDEVVAQGKNLDAKSIVILVSGEPAEVLKGDASSLHFRLPQIPATPGQEVKVVAQAGGETSPPATLYFGRLPLLLGVAPARGGAGDRITLTGRGFDASASGNSVTFAGEPALVFSASATELSVSAPTIPSAATQVEVPVVAQVQGRASNPGVFTLIRPSRGYFVPRYFPAPVPEHPGSGQAFVATELGPVIALGAPGDSASTADRAARVAESLTRLVDQAASTPVSFELRDSGGPAVAVVGRPEILVKVLPEDAAAYDEAFDASAKGRRPPAKAVAALWLALLQDQFALFVSHERPIHTVELTPRGKVFLDIYAEALRRAGAGAGVPEGIVSPLGAGLAKSLREVALSIPAEGQAAASASVEGTWRGTMEDSGTGSKGITLRVTRDGGKLSGGLTTRSGKLGAEVPLKEVAYDRGTSTLRFVLVVGGSPQYFSGTLQGDTIEGTIRASANAKDATGQFSVKYVD